MYNFVDVTEASGSAVLPSEALKINGEYIENQIEGYRTLRVAGREALSPELDAYETGVRDGSKIKSKRYPARQIIVTYQLVARTNEEFRSAYNKLGRILDVQDAELIFADEPDKFYIGTPSVIGEVDPGKNAVVAEIEILCADPFKYSIVEYEAEPWTDDGKSVLIDYNGTYKAFPTLEADFYQEDEAGSDGESSVALTGNGDCGYVAFFNEDEKIIQLGDPNEQDGSYEGEKSQTLTNQTFQSNTAWGTTAKNLWAVNSGNVIPNDVQQMGSVGMKIATYAVPSNPASTSGTILKNQRSDGGQPWFYYTVTVKTSGRTANTVKVEVAITTSLAYDGSYFGRGYGLTGSLYIGGAWHNVTLKTTSEYWRGKTAHTANMSFTVTGLTESQTALSGIKFKATRSDSVGGAAGILSEKACSNLAVSSYAASVPETYYLSAASYGTASGKYHGPSITRAIPADSSGVVGAADFTFSYKHMLCIGSGNNDINQYGGFHAHLSDSDGTIIAGVRIVKNSAGRNASLMLFVNGVKVHQVGIDISYRNSMFGLGGAQTTTIRKTGNEVVFNIAGYRKVFRNDAIKTTKVTKITFMFEQLSSYAALSYNGLYWAKFVKNNCNTFKNIPNKFSANDVLMADCKDGKVYLNGVSTPELGALGNDWEHFYLTPGLNQIGISYSDWVQDAYAPTIKVRYREVYL